jgi:hypothetical protein
MKDLTTEQILARLALASKEFEIKLKAQRIKHKE